MGDKEKRGSYDAENHSQRKPKKGKNFFLDFLERGSRHLLSFPEDQLQTAEDRFIKTRKRCAEFENSKSFFAEKRRYALCRKKTEVIGRREKIPPLFKERIFDGADIGHTHE